MASVCFYFQMHQPRRLRRYSVFDADVAYFDAHRNRHIVRKIANKCYLPATRLILNLIRKHEGEFRVGFSMTGCLIEQLREYAPEVLDLFGDMVDTGCCEFLAETYHHSLAFHYSKDEFNQQVDLHTRLIEDQFGQTPSVFRNTELIYNNELADHVAWMGRFTGVLAEGVESVLQGRTPNRLYTPPDQPHLPILLRNYRLSDDIAFRFSNRAWSEWPLTAEKYADWLARSAEQGETVNVFIDYETLGEHQWEETGIFDFMSALPQQVLDRGLGFFTPGETIEYYEPAGVYDVRAMTSWADTERDLSAWMGNAMQSSALQELYRLEATIKKTGDPKLLADWRMLTTSDHFYYMCTKFFADGDVHKYFNPYESPYDSYINYMNVLDHLRSRAAAASPA
ncbi:MAG: glycoside hydrolase family 57 protein [Phycisphaeraceae bacterium]